MDHFKAVLKKYAIFTGRSTRSEYWYFVLFSGIISIILSIIDSTFGLNLGKSIGLFNTLFSLAILVPGIAVTIRRLHDTNRSGWWALVGLIPFVGWIVLIVLAALDSTPGDNKYGSNPKGVASTAPVSPVQPL